MNTGWICPKCNAVMAPHVSSCINCKGNQSYTITSEGSSLPSAGFYPSSTYSETFKLCVHGVPLKFNSCIWCTPLGESFKT